MLTAKKFFKINKILIFTKKKQKMYISISEEDF